VLLIPEDDRSFRLGILAFLAGHVTFAAAFLLRGVDARITFVALAAQSLSGEPVAGTVLIVADDIGNEDGGALRQAAGRNNLLMLAVRSPQAAGTSLARSDAVPVSIDGTDIRTLQRRIETHFQAAQGDAFGAEWRDEGYWLLLPAALLSLLWFRRGTTVAWALALFLALQTRPANAQDSSWFRNLWLTPNQQGRLAFDRGDYATAQRLLPPLADKEDPVAQRVLGARTGADEEVRTLFGIAGLAAEAVEGGNAHHKRVIGERIVVGVVERH